MIDAIRALGLVGEAVLVGEPTGMAPVLGHKGKVSLQVDFSGKAGHSSRPDLGINALYAAAEFIERLRSAQAWISANGPFDSHYRIPHTTLHVGLMSGGTALNIIPDSATVLVEGRTIGTHPVETTRELFVSLAQEAARSVGAGTRFTALGAYPGLATARDHPFARLLAGICPNKAAAYADYGTEAGAFARDLGLPAIVCGPGEIDRAHKANEYILRSELADCLVVLNTLVAATGDQSGRAK